MRNQETEDIVKAYLITVFILIFLLLLAFAMNLIDERKAKERAISQMDARELHYDADDWFILINKSEGLIGIYDGTEPVQHIWLDEAKKIDEGTFPVLIYRKGDQ